MRSFLAGAGDVGRAMLEVDWESTPVGDPDQWEQSLCSAVRILLTSRFSMWMFWGSEQTFFCNDAYRRDTLGTKYPWALGRPTPEVWSEIWDDIQPRVDQVLAGESTWDEKLLLFLQRSGFTEETYHTFSYSPLYDDQGDVQGLFCVVNEDTDEVIAARRMRTLSMVGTRAGQLTLADTIATASAQLGSNDRCLPFSLIYLFEPDGRAAVLAGESGFGGDHPAAPEVIYVDDPDPVWPVEQSRRGAIAEVALTEERYAGLPAGAWPEPPTRALVVPLLQANQSAPYGFLVVALNRYRPLDEGYRSFVELVAGSLSAAITDALAYEFERQRAESLAHLDRAKTDFFTNVSHEFRTPLTLLLGPAEDALADSDQPLPAIQRDRLEKIHRNSQRLLKLVNSLLDFSRLESGQVEARFEPVDLSRTTCELVAMFDSAARGAGLYLDTVCEPLSAPVYIDPEQWAKVVLNLVSNALKFTFEGGITVRLREDDGMAVLTVRDTGTGIPEEELPRLFERFHRVPGARSRAHEGSGIGLALVAELAALHGGEVSVQSKLEEGTTFTVRLPFGSAHLPSTQVDDDAVAGGAARNAAGYISEAQHWLDTATTQTVPRQAIEDGRPQILVVDDNADMRGHVAALLARDYVVHTAADGVEALERVRAVRPDLVVTDVMMPRLDGFGLLERLQTEPAGVGIPVIMLSARAGERGTVQGLEAGADDYLVKPFSSRELLARVRVNLELDRARRVRSTLERSQELLDQAQRMARVGSWEIDLRSGALIASEELLRLLERDRDSVESMTLGEAMQTLVHPEDLESVRKTIAEAQDSRSPFAYEARLLVGGGRERLVSVNGEVLLDDSGAARCLRGSMQDITERRHAELALAASAAREEAIVREATIADELQRSLLPEPSFDLEHLDVATHYSAGVEGTQVGGDWYDVIELGAGRTAMVVGDVMGRGVRAAASMGQLRSAVRAFAKLELSPSEILEHLDGLVAELGMDQIVTCVYAVFDSTDQTLTYANAGHLPPLLVDGEEPVRRLVASGPPLGAGCFGLPTETVQLRPGATVSFYTDGLVERRDRDLDDGIDVLAAQLRARAHEPVAALPSALAEAMLPEGQDDDVAILVARVDSEPFEAAVTIRLSGEEPVVANARRLVTAYLEDWGVGAEVVGEAELIASELVTNAFLHGRPPIDIRLRRTDTEVVLEVIDRAPHRPRRRRALDEDENGRGLQIVSMLADSWGTRPTGAGKAVWCCLAMTGEPAR